MAEVIENKQKTLIEKCPNFNMLYHTSNELFFMLRDMWTGKLNFDPQKIKQAKEKSQQIEQLIQDTAGDLCTFEKRIRKDEISFHKDGRLSGDDEYLKQIYMIKIELDGILRRLKTELS